MSYMIHFCAVIRKTIFYYSLVSSWGNATIVFATGSLYRIPFHICVIEHILSRPRVGPFSCCCGLADGGVVDCPQELETGAFNRPRAWSPSVSPPPVLRPP